MAQPEDSALQKRIDQQLREYPGGTQVSDNAIAYGNGEAVVVFPSTGQDKAPAGLGANVRSDKLKTAGVLPQSTMGIQDVKGCPTGTFAYWYCFYQYRDFGGSRWQFKDTTKGDARDWGFDNKTSSVVNTKRSGSIVGYQFGNQSGELLFSVPRNTTRAYVGSAEDNRMTSWKWT
ncbi:peptidase inhibitor family I36 protein [Streptomyces sp. NPDC007094]|uniref:peptidase inhibitor family I36 protein n=1 Tax=Streptomyces sp. NPDC007094 TaxID=3155359 RepID=UPI0033FB6847